LAELNLQHEVWRLEGVVRAQVDALNHWRQAYDTALQGAGERSHSGSEAFGLSMQANWREAEQQCEQLRAELAAEKRERFKDAQELQRLRVEHALEKDARERLQRTGVSESTRVQPESQHTLTIWIAPEFGVADIEALRRDVLAWIDGKAVRG
jgi:hypothetical protein